MNRNVGSNLALLLTEDLRQEHLQILKTFTSALRDERFRCVNLLIAFNADLPLTDRTAPFKFATSHLPV